MKRLIIIITFLMFSHGLIHATPKAWKGAWITRMESQNTPNTWIGFRKTASIDKVPEQALAAIAADSKYWLWINGKEVVLEGGLKRGPSPTGTYYDEVDIAPFLCEGENTIAVLVCYFGKDGFSHISSGKAGLLFDCQAEGVEIVSDKYWHAAILSSYGTCNAPLPNFRLSESSLLYDARKEIGRWWMPEFNESAMGGCKVVGKAGCYPWNELVLRPIPQWKDFGLKDYASQTRSGDTIICSLPYNCQFTTHMKLRSEAGKHLKVFTDNYLFYDGAGTGIRSEYITKSGEQSYENPLWVNGHKVYYVIPQGVEVLELKFRESGYDCEFSGSFDCSDPFFNKLWEKARRSLYITMRDNFMDCPDRERAQWIGDAVNESLEAYYCLSTSSHRLVRKWLSETAGWQREDGKMFAPVPAGNWFDELPGQVLATVGYYGAWYYYLYSADRSAIAEVYPNIKKYLDLWEPDGKGTMKFRTGDWTWGDWGDNRDMVLIYNLWYYLGVKGLHNMAQVLGYDDDARRYDDFMNNFRKSFNSQFWTGSEYRHPDYKDLTDDRVHALAVVSGVADRSKYPAIKKVLTDQQHASPYMEKYVFEAMMQMGYAKEAMDRHRLRFGPMVNNDSFTTLFEGWGIGSEGYGGGTVNHGWSGGGLAVMNQYVCGVEPVEAGFARFSVLPQLGELSYARTSFQTVRGEISVSVESSKGRYMLDVEVPPTTVAIVGVPVKYRSVYLGDVLIWANGKAISNKTVKPVSGYDNYITFELPDGKHKLMAR